MEWSREFDGFRNQVIEYDVLEQRRPHHHKLRYLKISFNMGMRFPSWVGDPSYDQLTELTLCGCKSTQLPALGHLPALKELSIERMDEVENVGFEFIAPAADSNSFGDNIAGSFEVLRFDNMRGWQRWSTTDDNGIAGSFPRLREISIQFCPKLAQVSIPSIPSLRVLHIQTCPEAVLRSIVGACSSLVELTMSDDVRGLTQLRGQDLMHLGALEHLEFFGCGELRHLWEAQSDTRNTLSSLNTLRVSYCNNLVSLGEKEANIWVNMESLKEMEFFCCGMLESFSCPNSVEKLLITGCDSLASFTLSPRVLQEPSSSLTESIIGECGKIQPIPNNGFGSQLPLFCLREIHIKECKNLKSFPHEHFQRLTSLDKLWITDCPSMDSFPCGLWPPNLRELTLCGLNKPMSEWGPQNFPDSLVRLFVDDKIVTR